MIYVKLISILFVAVEAQRGEFPSEVIIVFLQDMYKCKNDTQHENMWRIPD
jgi:hypothetical protein